MLVKAIRAGHRPSGLWIEGWKSAAEVIEHCQQTGNLFDSDILKGATDLVETQLLVRRHWPRHTHALVAREKAEPDTVFIGLASFEELRRLEQSAEVEHARSQAEIRQRINEMAQLAAQPVKWADLAADIRSRICPPKSDDECWFDVQRKARVRRSRDIYQEALGSYWEKPWELRMPTWREPEAPYRELYIRIRGQIPDGVLLRHKCDIRPCVNPNHLEPGTHLDNARDRKKPGRLPSQVAARERGRQIRNLIRRFLAGVP